MRRTCYFASALILFFGVANTALADNVNGAPSTLGMSFDQVKQAAAQGDPDAEYALGYMYYYGKDGAVRDLISAKMWIEKAAAQGQPQAIKAAQLLGIADHPRQGGSTIKPQVERLVQSAQTEPKKPAVASAPVVASAKVSNHAMNQQRLLKTPSHYYTVQLLGAFNKQDITNFVNQHRLQAKTAVYKTYFHEKPWYVLVYGIYATDAAAEAAIKKMPASIRKLDPWVKSLASVHEGIKEGTKKEQHLASNHNSAKKHHKSLAKNNHGMKKKQTVTANNDASNDAAAANDNASQANQANDNRAANANDASSSDTAQNTVSANQSDQSNNANNQVQAANSNSSAQNNGNMSNQPQSVPQNQNNAANNPAPDQMQQTSMASEDTY